ncbi:MAG: fibronectin type III domain-containing protein [Deltaproteobacteria bacterium]|nr:fibronectin type III domain-containing protein [Deltaproteobacteria bacterium]
MRATRILLPVLLLAGLPARATNYTFEMEGNLTSPGRAYINIADCAAPDELAIGFDFSLAEGQSVTWVETQSADVFLSTSETCSSVSIEIGQTEENGEDLEIGLSFSQGQYPESGEDFFLSDIAGLDCAAGNQQDYYFCARWEFEIDQIVYPYNTDNYTYYAKAKLRYDTLAPGAPTLTELAPGDMNIKVYWEKPADEDLAGFLVYYREEDASDDAWQFVEKADPEATDAQISGLTIGTAYEFVVAAYDEAYNESEPSASKIATPLPVDDFWEYYRGGGGDESGGFCFVATAAYGSYGDLSVRALRRFRDQTLSQTEGGRSLVASYYRFGPRWARAIRHCEPCRSLARAGLVPAVALAELDRLGAGGWLLFGLALGLLGLLAYGLRRALGRLIRGRACALIAIFALAGLAFPPAARADEPPMPGAIRASSSAEPTFQLQIRFGPYYPNVDSEGFDEGNDETPFQTIFGGSSQMLFELGLDYEIWRGFGTVTAGGTIGFVQYVGKGRTESGARSSDTTVFNLIPVRLTAGYHFDLLAERWSIPLVPYVTGGLSYYFWWVLDGVGDVAEYTDDQGNTSSAQGGIFGLHFSAGLKLLLDWLDDEAAMHLETSVGIINTYLFAEFALSWVDGFGGSHFDVGDETFMFGLMMEF